MFSKQSSEQIITSKDKVLDFIKVAIKNCTSSILILSQETDILMQANVRRVTGIHKGFSPLKRTASTPNEGQFLLGAHTWIHPAADHQ